MVFFSHIAWTTTCTSSAPLPPPANAERVLSALVSNAARLRCGVRLCAGATEGPLQGREQPLAGRGAPRRRRSMAGRPEHCERRAQRSSENCESLSTTSRVSAPPRDASSESSRVLVVRLGLYPYSVEGTHAVQGGYPPGGVGEVVHF
jgi:hypothetical protein